MNMQGTSGFVVETSGLTKRFGDRVAVDSVELRVPRGSAFGYLGPNGPSERGHTRFGGATGAFLPQNGPFDA